MCIDHQLVHDVRRLSTGANCHIANSELGKYLNGIELEMFSIAEAAEAVLRRITSTAKLNLIGGKNDN